MIDIRFIRQNTELLKEAAAQKNLKVDIDRMCAVDDRRKAIQAELDRLKQEQNETGAKIANYRNPKSKYIRRRRRRAARRSSSLPRPTNSCRR